MSSAEWYVGDKKTKSTGSNAIYCILLHNAIHKSMKAVKKSDKIYNYIAAAIALASFSNSS
jgi:fucose 4-O-acetylase-like acetyltransferase